GINKRRSANAEEKITRAARGKSVGDGLLWKRFLEPHDIGTEQSAAARTFGRHVASGWPFGNDGVFLKAFCAHDVAVEFDDVVTAGALVQAIDVLRDEGEPGEARLHLCECEV